MLLKPADERGPTERSAFLGAATGLWMQQHQALEPRQSLPWFFKCQGTHRQGVSSRHPNHSCPACVTEGLWFNLLRKQICRLTLNTLHSSLILPCKHRVEWCRRSQGQLPAPFYFRNYSKNVLPLQKHPLLVSKSCGFLPLWISRVTHINNTWLRSMTQSRYVIY